MASSRDHKELDKGRLDRIMDDRSTLFILENTRVESATVFNSRHNNSDMVEAENGLHSALYLNRQPWACRQDVTLLARHRHARDVTPARATASRRHHSTLRPESGYRSLAIVYNPVCFPGLRSHGKAPCGKRAL